MAWEHLKAATESDLYDHEGSLKSILYRICSLVRREGQEHAGWCTASEPYLAETTGFSLRTVQRAVARFKKDGVFTVRTYRRGGKEFNHYRPNAALFTARKRNRGEAELVSEIIPDDTVTGGQEGTRHDDVWPPATVSPATRHDGGVVGIASEVEGDEVNALKAICRAELRSTSKGFEGAVSSKALTGKDHGGSAPEPPLCFVSRSESESESNVKLISPLESAAAAARSREEMLAAGAGREPVPAPPPREAVAPPPEARRPLPTTPFQVAKALVEETKRTAWDTYLRSYSLAYQFAGYLEERAARGEKAYAFAQWEIMYTADFIDAINRGWRFKDIEDAIDAAQTTKHRFVCCTPRRLLENGEALMKLVYALRRKGQTQRQRLGDRYPSWYLDNAGSCAVEEARPVVENEVAATQQQDEETCKETELDADVPIPVLKTDGNVKCINPSCPYRFDLRAQMYRHFDECFKKACEELPTDPQDALEEELADAFDDECGVLPCAIYPWFEEDAAEGRWDRDALQHACGETAPNLWAVGDSAAVAAMEIEL